MRSWKGKRDVCLNGFCWDITATWKRRPDEWRGNVNARDMTLRNLLEKNIYCVRDYCEVAEIQARPTVRSRRYNK